MSQPTAKGPGSRPQPAVALSNISKSYGDHVVLDDVSLEVHPGTVTAIIGSSGAGKSTLLRCINLLETPDTGTVRVDDLEVTVGQPISERTLLRLRRSVGMVFQGFNLFPHMTVLQNIVLPQLRVLRRPKDEAAAVAEALLTRMNLYDRRHYFPARCSGGQQQRVAIARALALEPKALLFDEPTSALDPELGREVLDVMRELAEDGITMIVVTHEINFAKLVANEVVIMASSKIAEQGPASEVIATPRTVEGQRFLSALWEA